MNKYIKKFRDRLLSTVSSRLGEKAALDLYKQLSSRFGVKSVMVSGESGWITGVPSDLVMGSYVQHHRYCPGIIDLITKRLLRNGKGTFIDIGAHIGLIAVPVARDSQAVVHAFEPEPNNFSYLTRNVTAILAPDRVTLHNIALVSSEGLLQFELSKDNFGDHRVRRKSNISKQKFDEAARQVIEVTGKRLDTVLNANDLSHPIVIKMDTQGAEIEVIQGGRRLLDAADYILTEYCPYMLLRLGSDPAEFIEFVRSFPYAAIVDDRDNSDLVLEPPHRAIEVMLAFPQDGSSAHHVDVLLAREADLQA